MGRTRLSADSAAPKAPPRFSKVEVVANVASGSVGPGAPDELAQTLAEFGLSAKVNVASGAEVIGRLRAAVDAAPDLLIVLAGDGTVRAAAEMCGPDGPVIAPLPGGTMNMLPYAVYGQRPWPEALRAALTDGGEERLGGGRVDGHRFLVAAILGSAALLAPAREAARYGKPGVAVKWLKRAASRAFTGRLRYSLDGGAREKAEALVMMCPIASKIMDADDGRLEVAALNPSGAAELVRMGFNALVRDWRADPAVEDKFAKVARVWASQGLPALLDGELVRLPRLVEIRYDPCVCRVLAPPKDER